MQHAPYRRIPLRDRAGTVVDEALVDEADYAALSAFRWHRSHWGYAVRRMPRRFGRATLWMHRQVLGLPQTVTEPASWFWSSQGNERTRPLVEVDHINGNTLDNRRANLRRVTRLQNAQNVSGQHLTSRHRGVSWFKPAGLWQVTATVGGRRHHLGYFHDEEEAARVARAFRSEHMPYARDE